MYDSLFFTLLLIHYSSNLIFFFHEAVECTKKSFIKKTAEVAIPWLSDLSWPFRVSWATTTRQPTAPMTQLYRIFLHNFHAFVNTSHQNLTIPNWKYEILKKQTNKTFMTPSGSFLSLSLKPALRKPMCWPALRCPNRLDVSWGSCQHYEL